jgi:hypothetical protein
MTAMEFWNRSTFLKHIGAALGRGVLVALVLPLLPLLLFSLPLMPTLALIATGFVIEFGAAPVGLTLGLPPLFVFYVLACTEAGIFIGLFDIFDTIGHTSAPVAAFLEKTRMLLHGNSLAERYGILGLIPCEILLGVYINAPVAWVLGWREDCSLVLTMAAYLVALAITILATAGFLAMYFPGMVPP